MVEINSELKHNVQNALLVLAIFGLIALVAYLVLLGDQVGLFLQGLYTDYGLAGLFIASILANASILLPVPIDIVVLASGKAFPPLLLGLFVGTGAAIGEMSGYIVGLGGKKAINKFIKNSKKEFEEINEKIHKFGFWFIVLGSFTPFPFDLIGIAAGLVRYDVYKFFIGAWIGKLFRYTLLAYAGLFGWEIVLAFLGVV